MSDSILKPVFPPSKETDSGIFKYHWTVQSPIIFELPNYIWKGRWKLEIRPRNVPWISINGIEVTPETTEGASQFGILRFICARGKDALGNKKEIKVIEHLLAALWATGITQADIVTDTKLGFIPAIWPGIEPLYSTLRWKVNTLKDQPLHEYTCPRKVEVKSKLKSDKFSGTIIIEPSASWKFEIEMTSKTKRGLKGKKSSPFQMKDVYWEVGDIAETRPIMRVEKHVKAAVSYLVGLRGLEKTTIPPDGEMYEEYQTDQNEQYAHAILDFLGELSIFFPGKIWAVKITVEWWRHPWRMDMLKQLLDQRALV